MTKSVPDDNPPDPVPFKVIADVVLTPRRWNLIRPNLPRMGDREGRTINRVDEHLIAAAVVVHVLLALPWLHSLDRSLSSPHTVRERWLDYGNSAVWERLIAEAKGNSDEPSLWVEQLAWAALRRTSHSARSSKAWQIDRILDREAICSLTADQATGIRKALESLCRNR